MTVSAALNTSRKFFREFNFDDIVIPKRLEKQSTLNFAMILTMLQLTC